MSSHNESWRSCFLETAGKGGGLIDASPKALSVDIRIVVNRSVRPTYPHWMQRALHPELERTGPITYDLRAILPWFHFRQQYGYHYTIGGHELYMYLKERELLGGCLSLRDGEVIQRKGLDIFRQFFGSQSCVLWKSVVQDHHSKQRVPYLYEYNGDLAIGWSSLDDRWSGITPALRFAN